MNTKNATHIVSKTDVREILEGNASLVSFDCIPVQRPSLMDIYKMVFAPVIYRNVVDADYKLSEVVAESPLEDVAKKQYDCVDADYFVKEMEDNVQRAEFNCTSNAAFSYVKSMISTIGSGIENIRNVISAISSDNCIDAEYYVREVVL